MIIATVSFGDVTAAAAVPAAADVFVAALPPEDEHAARASAATENVTATVVPRLKRVMISCLSNATGPWGRWLDCQEEGSTD